MMTMVTMNKTRAKTDLFTNAKKNDNNDDNDNNADLFTSAKKNYYSDDNDQQSKQS